MREVLVKMSTGIEISVRNLLEMDYNMKLFSFEENNLSQDFFKESYNYAVELLNLKNFKVKLFLTIIDQFSYII